MISYVLWMNNFLEIFHPRLGGDGELKGGGREVRRGAQKSPLGLHP